ncbi:MAG: DUF4296 domain-containing protein [Haliscomenobacter sp.]|uniref:DUF4296 domain-containing protein n=1 Tax=Haliscomenobacter sp. TaxID=2717303 RepID=UPI0029A1F63E|nr:DUF4296 domain-containing protein [Haliscomenobacter sp.]MDX2067541.1 DUF4296 domain-containing protein [Haliscomenobacter sp.]
MKLRIIFFLMFFSFFACNRTQKKLPIPEKKLIQILTDVHYAEAALQDVYGIQKDSLKKIYYQEIYQLYETSEEELTKTMDVLRQNPERLDKIYQFIVDNLNG